MISVGGFCMGSVVLLRCFTGDMQRSRLIVNGVFL